MKKNLKTGPFCAFVLYLFYFKERDFLSRETCEVKGERQKSKEICFIETKGAENFSEAKRRDHCQITQFKNS